MLQSLELRPIEAGLGLRPDVSVTTGPQLDIDTLDGDMFACLHLATRRRRGLGIGAEVVCCAWPFRWVCRPSSSRCGVVHGCLGGNFENERRFPANDMDSNAMDVSGDLGLDRILCLTGQCVASEGVHNLEPDAASQRAMPSKSTATSKHVKGHSRREPASSCRP